MFTNCNNCNVKLKVPETLVGKKVRCPKCSTVFLVECPPELPSPPKDEESIPSENSVAHSNDPSSQNDEIADNDAPSKPHLFRSAFFADLNAVFLRLFRRTDPRACLPDLTKRFQQRREYLRQFCADLDRIIDATDDSPRRYLALLAGRFSMWRTETENQIDGFLKSLPQDDPLNCSISLFGTLDYGRHERAHTKTLAWLLDPNGDHGFGPVLLKSLLGLLESEFAAQFEFDTVSSVAEKLLDQENRIDVFIEGRFRDDSGISKKCYLVIEAKIDAIEGPEQAARYDEWIDVNLAPSPVARVFLTPDRRAPVSTEMSESWKCVSFMDLAILFRKELAHLQQKAGYHFLRHYLTGVFKDIYQWRLPIRDPKQCVDPYGFLAYVAAIPM